MSDWLTTAYLEPEELRGTLYRFGIMLILLGGGYLLA